MPKKKKDQTEGPVNQTFSDPAAAAAQTVNQAISQNAAPAAATKEAAQPQSQIPPDLVELIQSTLTVKKGRLNAIMKPLVSNEVNPLYDKKI